MGLPLLAWTNYLSPGAGTLLPNQYWGSVSKEEGQLLLGNQVTHLSLLFRGAFNTITHLGSQALRQGCFRFSPRVGRHLQSLTSSHICWMTTELQTWRVGEIWGKCPWFPRVSRKLDSAEASDENPTLCSPILNPFHLKCLEQFLIFHTEPNTTLLRRGAFCFCFYCTKAPSSTKPWAKRSHHFLIYIKMSYRLYLAIDT